VDSEVANICVEIREIRELLTELRQRAEQRADEILREEHWDSGAHRSPATQEVASERKALESTKPYKEVK